MDPGFAASVRNTDFLVADEAFGCGSAMEVAVTVVQAAGIRAVLAKSFSRTYFRNAINNGLIPVECDTSGISEGDEIRVRVDSTGVGIYNSTTDSEIKGHPIPTFVLRILEAGGLVPYLRTQGGFPEEAP